MSCQSPNSPSAPDAPPSDRRRNTRAPPLELRALDKLRVEQAGELQSVTLPWASLRAGSVMLGHEASPRPISSIISNRRTEELDDVSGQTLPAAPCVMLAVGSFEVPGMGRREQPDDTAVAPFIFAVERCRRRVPTKACREWAKRSAFAVDRPGALQ